MYSPIVMIAFNRPDLVRLTLQNVALSNHADAHDIYMFIDGPRDSEDETKQNEIYTIAVSYQSQLPLLKIIRRDINLGCRGNIVDAITTIVNRYGRAIVIEDDILISRTFLDYMDEALEFYKEDKRIWSINAYQHPYLRVPRQYKSDVYLNPINMCWGWGTWRDRWVNVDFDLKDWPLMRQDPAFVEKANKAGRQIIPMLEAQFAGRLKTWDIQCTYHLIKNGLMSVEPVYRLSKNIGFGKVVSGEHFSGDYPLFSRQKYYNFRPILTNEFDSCPELNSQFEWLSTPQNLIQKYLRKFQRSIARYSDENNAPCEIAGRK